MSYLYRNGTGRNNIVWGGGTTTSLNYLRRTNTSINSIQWYTISTSGTYNILERYDNTRNGIRWNNIVFSFGGDLTKYKLSTNGGSNITWYSGSTIGRYMVGTVTKNSYTSLSKIDSTDTGDYGNESINIFTKNPSGLLNEINKFKTCIMIARWNSGGIKELSPGIDRFKSSSVSVYINNISMGQAPTLVSITFS